jgi:hypothetical protein
MALIDLKNVTVKIRDGTTPTPNEIEVKIGEGNFTYDERRNMEYVRDRGKLDTVREGDEEPVDIRMDAQWDYITGDGDITIEDALKQRGAAAGWKSSDTDPCAPYAVDLVLINEPECVGDFKETLVFADFRWESLAHDARGATISTSGKANITEATATRAAIPS